MARLSVAQIYNAARQAGFAPDKAVVATAIALAESSGGDPTAHCLNCFPGVTEDSRGLWQINVDAHPQYAGWNLYDPATNARAAFAVASGGKSFSPWSTYTSGSYLSRLPTVYSALGIKQGAQPPASVPGAQVPQSPSSSSTGSPSSSGSSSSSASFLDKLNPFSALGNDLARIAITGAFVVGGVTLAVLGLYKGVQPAVQRIQTQAAGVAGDVAKAAAL